MNKILAIENSSTETSVALLLDNKIFLKQENNDLKINSKSLLTLIQNLLEHSNITLGKLTAIAFSAGPGSFTGIRIACAAAQGLGFGLDIPVIAVDSLKAYAQQALQNFLHKISEKSCTLLVVVDARIGEVYWAEYLYEKEKSWKILQTPQLSTPNKVQATKTNYYLTGNASNIFPNAAFVTQAIHCMAIATPRADCIAYLANQKLSLSTKTKCSQDDTLPIYIRNIIALTAEQQKMHKFI